MKFTAWLSLWLLGESPLPFPQGQVSWQTMTYKRTQREEPCWATLIFLSSFWPSPNLQVGLDLPRIGNINLSLGQLLISLPI